MENNYFFVLGVLTKPDLVDKGAEEDIITMVRSPERFQIRKGFTVVKLRSKEEITNGVTLQQALLLEQQWFEKSPHFRSVFPRWKVVTTTKRSGCGFQAGGSSGLRHS